MTNNQGCIPEEINGMYLGGLLRDIGKIGIPETNLLEPTESNKEEWKIVHARPKLGTELISPIK